MTEKIVKLLFTLLLIFLLVFLWFNQSRSFYCIGSDRCITVWKRLGNVCYIIPYKYYGLSPLKQNYIKLSNTADITFYWSDSLDNKIIFRTDSKFFLENNSEETLLNYYDSVLHLKLEEVIYHHDAKRIKDVKPNVGYINVDIRSNHARDKEGKKI